MADNRERIGTEDGLTLQGPLSGSISTMKVGVRPPDIPLIEKVEALIDDVRKGGGVIPDGSELVIRSIDGFVQFKDLKNRDLMSSEILTIIEFDPSRGTFLTSGEGKADLVSEASWYIMKALTDHHILFMFKEEGSTGEIPEESRSRSRVFLDVASRVFKGNDVSGLGYRILKFRTLDEFASSKIFETDHSKSQ